MLPTTFRYAEGTLPPFSGAIEHAGGIVLGVIGTTIELELGNFTIGFDDMRIGGPNPDATGFFVRDNIDVGAVLFDLTSPLVEAFDNSLVITANLAISQELSDFLNGAGVIGDNVTGVDAGLALAVADASVVPVPAAVWLFGSALALLGWVRRKA